MKTPSFRLFGPATGACACSMAALIFTLTLGGAGQAGAETRRKENNTDTLDQGTSWVQVTDPAPDPLTVPGTADIAQWDNQLTFANTSDLGTARSWLGIKVLDPAGAATITGLAPNILTVGASGIDLSAASQNLTISSPLVLGSAQTWNVASGRFLNITTAGVGAVSGTGPLTVRGPGGVRLGGLAATYTFTGGLSVTGGTGLGNVAATPGGSALISAANLVFDLAAITPTGTTTAPNIPPTFSIPSGSPLTVGGGTVHTIGGVRSNTSGTPAWVQSSSLAVAAGHTNFTQSRGSSARTINQFSSVTRAVAGTLNFRDPINSDGTGNANTGGYRMATTLNINGIVPFATYTTSATNTAWFVAAGTGNNGTSAPTLTVSTATTLGTSTQNADVGTDVALSVATTVNSIRFNSGSARTVTLDPAIPLTIGAGAILVTPNGSASHTITGGVGSKVMGGNPVSVSDKELIIHQHNNTSTFSINAEIADNVTATALTKCGAGKFAIGGQSTYTGTTYVNAGSLLVNGGLTASPTVIVRLGGTLGGTGTISGTVAADGVVAPGVTIGTLTAGPVTFNSGSSLAVQINTATSTADKLVVNGGVSTGGSKVNLVLSDLGYELPLANGTKFTLVDYTTTWPGTDLLTYAGNTVADNSTITFGPNKFLVNYSDAAVDGTALTLTVVDAVAPTPFQTWINSYAAQIPLAANRLPDVDPDGDGRKNLLEYAFDGNPASATDNGKMSVSTDDSNDVGTDHDLTVTLAVRNDAVLGAGPDGSITLTVDGIVYTIGASADLLVWDKAVNEVTPANPLVPAPSAGWTARTFQVSDSNALPEKRFIRVGVQ